MTNLTKTRPAMLAEAEVGTVIRMSWVRTATDADGETYLVREHNQPVYDKFRGKVATFDQINSVPYPTIKFTIDGTDREFIGRPDFHIEIEEEMTIFEALDRVTETAHRWRSGTIDADTAAGALLAADALFKTIKLRAYPMGSHPDETSEQVVVTILGVDVSIRRREHDLFVHVDDERSREDGLFEYPLCVQVNDSGEQDYSGDQDDEAPIVVQPTAELEAFAADLIDRAAAARPADD